MPSISKYGFYDAKMAREIAIGNKSSTSIVLEEINFIEEAIDNAASNSNLEVMIPESGGSGPTPITSDPDYYTSWNDPNTAGEAMNTLYRERMNQVIAYFSRLGYRISRDREDMGGFIKWIVKW